MPSFRLEFSKHIDTSSVIYATSLITEARHPLQHAQLTLPSAPPESDPWNSNTCPLLFYWLWIMCFSAWHLRLSSHGLKLSQQNPLFSPVPPAFSSEQHTHFPVMLHHFYPCGASHAIILLRASSFLITVTYLEIVPPSFWFYTWNSDPFLP